MNINPANAKELGRMAREVGAVVLEGDLHYPSDSGGWQLDDLDLSEYLDQYRNQRLVLIVAPLGEAQTESFTCGICGFVMDKLQSCPRCKFIIQDEARVIERQRREQEQLLADIRDFLNSRRGSGSPD